MEKFLASLREKYDTKKYDPTQFDCFRDSVMKLQIKKKNDNDKLADLYSELNLIEKEITEKTRQLVQSTKEQEILESNLKELKEEHVLLKAQEEKSRMQMHSVEINLKKLENQKISEKDEATLANMKLRALLFKNLLQVKFKFSHVKRFVSGYVFNKKNVKYFNFETAKSSNEKIVKMIWEIILECADTADWPKISY